MSKPMLEIVLFLRRIGKEQETAGGVLTGPFWPTDATSRQHSGSEPDMQGPFAASADDLEGDRSSAGAVVSDPADA